jgi:hypothetical protein
MEEQKAHYPLSFYAAPGHWHYEYIIPCQRPEVNPGVDIHSRGFPHHSPNPDELELNATEE